jgi:glyoxylase-like metal-dependent hydrolase (beta-lactamase superfamily II)
MKDARLDNNLARGQIAENAKSRDVTPNRPLQAVRHVTVVLGALGGLMVWHMSPHPDVAGRLIASTTRQPPTAPVSAPVSVRYVANAGVLVEMAGARVLIDAPVREGIPPYATSSADERTRLERAQPPYADVDAILVTHWHEDHFSAKAVAAHLASSPRTVLASSPEVVARVRAVAPGLGVTRLQDVLPAPGAWERVHVGPLTARAAGASQPDAAAAAAARGVPHR